MKRIDLGNNVNVEVTDEVFKITSASGSTILLDCNGEFLNYTNEVGIKRVNERKEFLGKFVKIEQLKRKVVVDWINEYPKDKVNTQKSYFFYFSIFKLNVAHTPCKQN